MRIAVPLRNGRLSKQFSLSEAFAVAEVNDHTKEIVDVQTFEASGEATEAIPAWLGLRGVNVVIACGMEAHERRSCTSRRIDVVEGTPDTEPKDAVRAYLDGALHEAFNG